MEMSSYFMRYHTSRDSAWCETNDNSQPFAFETFECTEKLGLTGELGLVGGEKKGRDKAKGVLTVKFLSKAGQEG